MPYIIATETPSRLDQMGVGPTAVATLDEARQAAAAILYDAPRVDVDADLHDAAMPEPNPMTALYAQADNLPDTGGTIGPLPDGTVIDVQRVTWVQLAGLDTFGTHAEVLAAFNQVSDI